MAREDKIVEDAPFDVPPFDEKEFIRKELISFRTTVILFVFSVVVAGISFVIEKFEPEFSFFFHLVIAMAVGALAFRFLFRAAKIDISHWKRKEWLGTTFLYFVFWLGFFLLFVNPPFTDAASPFIDADVRPRVQAPGQAIEFGAYIADNVGIRAESVTFCILNVTSGSPPLYSELSPQQRSECSVPWSRAGEGPFWKHNATFARGRYAWYATAEDSGGQLRVATGEVRVGSPFTSKPALPRQSSFVVPDDRLSVQVAENLDARAVQFSLDGGMTWNDFRIHPDPDRAKTNWWTTDPSYKGWSAGRQNVTLRVDVQPRYFLHAENVVAGVALDPDGPYALTVSEDLPGIGQTDPPGYGERRFIHPGQTPGVGTALAVTAVAALALAGRRRRDG